MKPIIPSLREKKRYVIFEVIGSELDKKKVEEEIYNNLLNFFGELGISRANIKIVSDSWKKNKGVVMVNVKYLNELKVGIGLIKKVNNKKVILNIIGVSGILKKAKKKFMEK